ncbi:RHS repeat-associated core domain-containing protein [Asticcacaulis sp.]|uniref:RHS repeat-associated core domain-containing protein n=1 Tax=Asticcacaulis sp. TaxID=1872648 RepID=UPI00261B9EF6|nr:RHS repeat-associated core domain-containing protein [Asticcacaulis sp.]
MTRHSYDLLGRRTATTRGAASSLYGYDIAGQLRNLNHAWSGGSLAASYLYDDAGALISEALDNSAFLWQPAPTLAKTTTYDPASPINALTKVDGVAQTHDARGNRTGAAGRTWRYDTRNMLVGANAPGMAATYGYYPEGGRAWKQVNGVTTLYLELDGIEWGTYDASGTLKERTIRASGNGGAVVAIHAPAAGLIRLLPNRQGSVIGWLRPDGKLGGAYTYDAYGNSPQAGAAGPQFRYAGMRLDAETGLYHTPNRAYDPQDGRWMQLDPAGLVDGLNRYAYVSNSPVNGADPTGLVCVAANRLSDYCRRAEIYRRFDMKFYDQTRFFAAASMTTTMLASMDIPVLGGLAISSNARSFLSDVSASLEDANAKLAMSMETVRSRGGNIDLQLIRKEQDLVQGHLNNLRKNNIENYTKIVSEINNMLNSEDGFSSTMNAAAGLVYPSERHYHNMLSRVREQIGGDIDFSNQEHREAIGRQLVNDLRDNGGCDRTGSRIKSC